MGEGAAYHLHHHHIKLFLAIERLGLYLDLLADKDLQLSQTVGLLDMQRFCHLQGGIDHKLICIIGAIDPQDLPQYLVADRFHCLDSSPPLALWALGTEDMLQALASALARHLHQAQMGEAIDGGLGPIPSQSLLQAL